MERRKFLRTGSLLTIGATLLHPFEGFSKNLNFDSIQKNKKAKNIILVISDGMSMGTLNMADIYLNHTTGKGSKWIQLYKDNRVSRGLMYMASSSSIITKRVRLQAK